MRSKAPLIRILLLGLILHTGWFPPPLRGDGRITATDAHNRVITLDSPARRIVSLAPNLTELLFAVEAGEQLVGVADFSDFPPAAKALPRVGGYDRFDPEAVLAARPDLVVGWSSGNPEPLLQQLERFGLTVFRTDPRKLADIPRDLERLGVLTGHEEPARKAAADFRDRLTALQNRFQAAPRVRMFYQVWHEPLMTVNGAHLISDVMALCAGENVFAALPDLAPVIDQEAVLATDPEVIMASGMDASRPEWLNHWRAWPPLTAARRDNLFFIPPDLLQRHTPRVLEGAEQLCLHLETARRRRPNVNF
ncbi:MAG: cobalamin-binding protein [Magnetococcales bacterium]|nr:cobalamin-binding protein [Magnetococcales bacterium]